MATEKNKDIKLGAEPGKGAAGNQQAVQVAQPVGEAVQPAGTKTGYWAERGGGMLIFTAHSMEEAKAIVSADPLIENHCVDYELHEWCVVAGQ